MNYSFWISKKCHDLTGIGTPYREEKEVDAKMIVTELKRYQRRRYRLKQWWISERAGFGWGTRGRREKNGYNPMNFPDLEWD
jgi:hypothetical protein